MTNSIGVVFITHNAKHHLAKCLPPVLASKLKPRVLVVNSSSGDGTVALAEKLGAETLVVPRNEFNHGVTRELARKHLGTEIVVMMTPDAYLKDSTMLEKLVQPLLQKQASASYARQIAHKGAGFFETFPRTFNYPELSHIRSIDDIATYGVYTFFCSDSCAAYRNEALDEVGGFQHVLTGEDTVIVAKLLKKRHRIAYTAEALVHHSHAYTLTQEFKRHFDTGLARQSYGDLLSLEGYLCKNQDAKRGQNYVKAFLGQLLTNEPLKIPYGILQCCAKWCGYHLGRKSINWPTHWKKRFSSQDFYWVNNP